MSSVSAGLASYEARARQPLSLSRVTPVDRIRCRCRRCGSHVPAIVLKQTISGTCSTCKSYDIAPLET